MGRFEFRYSRSSNLTFFVNLLYYKIKSLLFWLEFRIILE